MPAVRLPYLPQNYELNDEIHWLELVRVEKDGSRKTIGFFGPFTMPETLQKAVAEDQARQEKKEK
jgi:hypothetical protein